MVSTRRSKIDNDVESEGPTAIDAHDDVLDEIDASAEDDAGDIVAAIDAADGKPDFATAEAAATDVAADGAEPAAAEVATVEVAEAPGDAVVETVEVTEPASNAAAEIAAVTVEGADQVPPEVVEQAIAEAVDTAKAAAEASGQPAVAQATIEVTPEVEAAATDAEPTDIGRAADDAPLADATQPADGAPAAEAAPAEEGGEPSTSETAMMASDAGKSGAAFRLFVGCVPPQFKESDLKPYFEESQLQRLTQIAPVKEVTVLRDQVTGTSRGCAFAVYSDKGAAERAIEKLDKKFTLPGSMQPIEVRFARESSKVQPSAEPNDRNQLFYARAPVSVSEQDIKDLFAEFGEVAEVALFMNRAAGLSKGCGFVFYKERAHAQAAIDALHDKKTMTGGFTPLTVKWADPNLNEKKRKAAEDAMDPNRDNLQIFFARIPKNVEEDAVKKVFEGVGDVRELVLFKSHSAAPINKGCGIVTMQTHAEAVKVLESLDNVHTFEGMDVAMVLKWVDQDLQKRRRMEREPGGLAAFGPPGGPWRGGPPPYGAPPMGGPPGAGYAGDEERPPRGCDPNAYKLYLAGVPRTWELPDLSRVVEKYGQVIEMNLVRDKITKEPKGVAFVWYRTKSQADQAIRDLNNQSFEDGQGSNRTIQVSRAKARRQPMLGGGTPMGPSVAGPGGYGRPPGGYQGYQAPRPPPQPAYQQPAPYYQQPPQAYNPYAQAQAPAAPQAPTAGYGGYQNTAYQAPAYQGGGYQAAQYQGSGYQSAGYQNTGYQSTGYQASGYQAQQQPAYDYQQSQAQTPAPAQAYQQPQPQPQTAYQQSYAQPSPVAGGYAAAPAASTTPTYGTSSGYEPQAQQQAAYGTQQYATAGSTQQQSGYNYGAAAAATPQSTYSTAAAPAAAGTGQYSYSAPAQGYGDAGGYNYGAPTG